jgi:dihydrofolate reductase
VKLTLHTFLTVDGVMQGPGGADEDRSGGFDRGGWLVPYVDEDFGEITSSWFDRTEAILLGRTTYEMMYPYWSQVEDPDNIAGVKLNGAPKFIASSTLRDPEWNNSTVLSGDVLEEVERLKRGGGDGGELQVHGSCGLARSLHAAGLIDEYRLLVFPVCVGEGKRLFTQDGPPTGLSLLSSRVTSTGAVYCVFAPAPFTVGEVDPSTETAGVQEA